jgi:AraC-like DNA-binding protein
MKPPPAPPAAQPSAAPDFFSLQVSDARRFYLDLNPPRKQRLAVVCGGIERTAADYAIHRDGFPFYSLEYVARGAGEVTLQGRSHALKPGTLFAYGPDIRQDIVSQAGNPLVKYFVNFAGSGSLPLLRQCQLEPGNATQIFPPNELHGTFDELIAAGIKGTRHSPELCSRLLECLAIKILEARAPSEASASLSFATYQQSRGYIQQHFLRLKTLRQIAEECHIDQAYLCRLFRRYDHQSPYHYLLRLKMNQAAQWLLEPGALIKQVAERAGFADPFHFSRAFKSVFGLSPDRFRKLH